MEGGVSRCVLGAHVSSVEQQVFQVLHMAIAAGLKNINRSFVFFFIFLVHVLNECIFSYTLQEKRNQLL